MSDTCSHIQIREIENLLDVIDPNLKNNLIVFSKFENAVKKLISARENPIIEELESKLEHSELALDNVMTEFAQFIKSIKEKEVSNVSS